jgi:hypothetical protein
MTFLYSQHPALMQYIEKYIPHIQGSRVFKPETTSFLANLGEDDEILAVVAFHDWTEFQVEVSIATDGNKRWLSRKFLDFVYSYAFIHSKKLRMTMITEETNENAINMHTGLGHVKEGCLRDWFGPGKNACIYGFTISDWENSRFILKNRKNKGIK